MQRLIGIILTVLYTSNRFPNDEIVGIWEVPKEKETAAVGLSSYAVDNEVVFITAYD